MTDKQLKGFILKAGLVQTVVTLIVGALMWAYSVGKAQADVVRRPELANVVAEQNTKLDRLQISVNETREGVQFLKGKLESVK